MQTVEPDQASMYHEFVYAMLPAAARRFLEDLMRTITIENLQLVSPFARSYAAKGRAEGLAEGLAEGKAEARAQDVLAVLDARDVDVPDSVRDRIAACSDLGQLDIWIRRAATVTSTDELFVD